ARERGLRLDEADEHACEQRRERNDVVAPASGEEQRDGRGQDGENQALSVGHVSGRMERPKIENRSGPRQGEPRPPPRPSRLPPRRAATAAATVPPPAATDGGDGRRDGPAVGAAVPPRPARGRDRSRGRGWTAAPTSKRALPLQRVADEAVDDRLERDQAVQVRAEAVPGEHAAELTRLA